MGLEPGHLAAIGSAVGSVVGGPVARASGGHLFCLMPERTGLLPGTHSVGLVLGQESASRSTDGRTVTRFEYRYGSLWVPERAPHRPLARYLGQAELLLAFRLQSCFRICSQALVGGLASGAQMGMSPAWSLSGHDWWLRGCSQAMGCFRAHSGD